MMDFSAQQEILIWVSMCILTMAIILIDDYSHPAS